MVTVCCTPWISTIMKTRARKIITSNWAAATPRYLPMTKIGRETGFETTVRTVRLSISRVRTFEATKAERIAPPMKIVERPMSTYIRWSSCSV